MNSLGLTQFHCTPCADTDTYTRVTNLRMSLGLVSVRIQSDIRIGILRSY